MREAKLRPKTSAVAAFALTLGAAGLGSTACTGNGGSCSQFSGQMVKSVSALHATPDLTAAGRNAQNIASLLHSRATGTTDTTVKAALDDFASDVDSFADDVTRAEGGDNSVSPDLTSLGTKIGVDASALDVACR